MKKARLVLTGPLLRSAVVAVGALLVVACSDDSDDHSPETTTTFFASTTRPPTTTTVTTGTTVSSTTTSVTNSTLGGVTTTSISIDCGVAVVTFSVTNAETLGALQFDTDYSAAGGDFDGVGGSVSCQRLAGDFAAFNDHDDEKRLSMAFVSTAGFTGPIDIATCDISCDTTVFSIDDFVVTITDQSKPDFTPASATVAVTRVDSTYAGGTTTTTPVASSTTVP